VPDKDKRALAADRKKTYTAADRDHAETELERFAEKWNQRFPMISASRIERFEQIVPFLAFAPDPRRVVYTTDESFKGRGASTVPDRRVSLRWRESACDRG
jgi:putative transposase